MRLPVYIAQILAGLVVVTTLVVASQALLGETSPPPRRPAAAAPSADDAPASGGEKRSADKTEPKKKRQIKVVAGHWQYDNKKMIHVLTPSETIKQVTIREVGEDYEMVADRIEYDDRNSIATGTGHLHFSNPDTTIVGDLLVVDFDQKKAVLTGNVKLTSHGKETEEKTDEELPLKEQYRKKKTVVTCDKLEYWYKEKRAVATGNLQFEQGDRHGTARTATYLEIDDVLLLEGDVQVTNKKGETAKAPQVVIDNKKDTMTADQGVEITFFVEEEEQGGAKGSGKKGKAGEGAGGAKPSPQKSKNKAAGTGGAKKEASKKKAK